MMKNSIRCCISCILPCGALDVIRIVHANGRVQEINQPVQASDIMRAYPNHVLKNYVPSKIIVIVPPEAQLQRGKIYFLMPAPPPPSLTTKNKKKKNKINISDTAAAAADNSNIINSMSASSDRYLTEILSTEKIISTGKDYRRRGRTGVWRPHLESILESTSPPSLETFY